MKKGDIVGRLSYNCDIIFKIIDIIDNKAYLSGLYVRLLADSSLDDLKIIDNDEIEKYKNEDLRMENIIIESYKDKIAHITGKILHIDSDTTYLDKCMRLYKSLNIYANGLIINEESISISIIDNIRKYRPNIVIITGHDSYNKKGLNDLENYKNTLHFMKAILKIREQYSLDDICIYAGACGSNFEALIASGANFASSINRGNIEAYDPAIVGILAAITPLDQIIDIKNLYNFSKMKKGSIGGVETYGKMRLLMR
ncbi:MAG: sporulation peptidase YabG [Anaeroplasma sp.]